MGGPDAALARSEKTARGVKLLARRTRLRDMRLVVENDLETVRKIALLLESENQKLVSNPSLPRRTSDTSVAVALLAPIYPAP